MSSPIVLGDLPDLDPPSVVAPPRWTRELHLVLGVCIVGLLAAIPWSYRVSAVAYAVIVVASSVLLFLQRRQAIVWTRKAGNSAVVGVGRHEKAVLALVVLTCGLHSVIVGLEVATW